MAINNRYEFVLLFDVVNGNPNGDPICDGAPRIDPDTNIGFVSPGCLKRKIRNAFEIMHGEKDGYDIYIKKGCALLDHHKKIVETMETYKDLHKTEQKYRISEAICKKFIDVRLFGGALSAIGEFAGDAIQGPIQLGMAESIHPISISRLSITRCCRSTEVDDKENQQFGHAYVIPYGLYKVSGYISVPCAQKTGLTEDDLNCFFDAIKQMFEFDRANYRMLQLRKLFIFRHNSPYGNVPAHLVLDHVKVGSTKEVPTKYEDYSIMLDTLPETVELDSRSLI